MRARVEGREHLTLGSGGRGEQSGLATGSGAEVGPRTVRGAHVGQGEGDERRALVLDAGAALGDRGHVAGNGVVEVDADG